jgi:hypothetical protein
MSLKRRIGVIVSVVWLIAIFVVSLNINVQYDYRHRSSIDGIGLFTGFVVFGAIPVIVGFGFVWITAAARRKP